MHDFGGLHHVEFEQFCFFQRRRLREVPRKSALGVVDVVREVLHHSSVDRLRVLVFKPGRRDECVVLCHASSSLR